MKAILPLFLVLLLVSCHKAPESDDAAVAVNETDNAPAGPSSALPKSGASNVPQAFVAFMDDNHPLSGQSGIGFFEQADLTGDGAMEAVLGVKDRMDEEGTYTEIYMLQQVNGRIVQLDDNLVGGGNGVYDIALVHLDDRSEPVLETKLTNSGSMEGFELFALKNGKPLLLEDSASPTGVGNDVLIDMDLDGAFDGYAQHRTSYDVLYYDVLRVFELQNGHFVQTATKVALPDYPGKPKDVVAEYLSLRALAEFNDAPEVEQRLKDICPACTKEETGLAGKQWTDAFYGSGGYAGDLFNFGVKAGDGAATVVATNDAGGGVPSDTLEFHLVRTGGEWIVDGVKRPAAAEAQTHHRS